MTCHIFISRISPSVTLDSIRFCDVIDGRATPIEDDIVEHFASIPVIPDLIALTDKNPAFLLRTVSHDRVADFVRIALGSEHTTVDYFDNNLILVLDYE
ncbi:hypothetical protein [Dipodfec virus UOA04_Rod_653]|nr:hypothetical protein [Dipodfec virus UOA04_Rod_653]